MKIFVTGGSGAIGRKLLPVLLQQGHTVTVLGRAAPADGSWQEVRLVTGDLLQPETYRHALEGIEAIVHMAAVTHTNDAAQYYRVNRDGTGLLLQEAGRAGVGRFIFVSTRAVGAAGGPYSDSKAQAERLVENSSLQWLIVRPAEVYGTDGNEMVGRLVDAAHRLPFVLVPGDGSQRLAPVHVDDLVEAIGRLIGRTPPLRGTFTLAGPEDFTFDELIDRVLQLRRARALRIHVPLFVLSAAAAALALLRLRRPPLVKDQIARLLLAKDADIGPAQRAIDFRPRSLQEHLRGHQ